MARKRKTRRAPGEGSIRLRPDTGRYQAGLLVGYNEVGNPLRIRRDFDTFKDAELWLAQQRVAQARGELLIQHNETVGQRIEGWLESRGARVAERTLHDYRTTLARYVTPHLGRVKLKDLKPLHIDQLLTKLHQEGRSAYTIEKAHRYLSMVLIHAVELELIPRNVARHVRPAAPPKRKAPRWSAADAQGVLEHCSGLDHPVARYIIVGLLTGLRREELLGLKWVAVDLRENRLEVNSTVTFISGRAVESPLAKTAAGYRTLYFDELAGAALKQQLEHVHLAQAAASDWQDRGFVFPSSRGTPLSERFLRDHFQAICKAAGVPIIRLYDLRSTHGSILADAGVNPKLISERLGHASVGFTMDVYVRTQAPEQRALAAAFRAAVSGKSVADDAESPQDSESEEAAD